MALLRLTTLESKHNYRLPSMSASQASQSPPLTADQKANKKVASASHNEQADAGNAVANHLEHHDLSKRELQIVELVTAGLTNQEISDELAISKRTVDNHVSNVLNKTDTGNRVALVRWALQSGKVCIDELNCCHLPKPS